MYGRIKYAFSYGLVISLGFLITSCATQQVPQKKEEAYRKRVYDLEVQVDKLERDLLHFKTANAILKQEVTDLKRKDGVSARTEFLRAEEKQILGGNKRQSEFVMYSKVVESYNEQNLKNLIYRVNIFKSKYPKSSFLEDGYFLIGKLASQNQNFRVALRSYNEVIKNYPKGDRVSSALFAKGLIYQRLNLRDQARSTIKMLLNDYPSSAEASMVDPIKFGLKPVGSRKKM